MHVVPATHTDGPVYPWPPHCPNLATEPEELADAAVEVAGADALFGLGDDALVVTVVGAGLAGLADVVTAAVEAGKDGLAAPPEPAPHVATGPPGPVNVDMLKP